MSATELNRNAKDVLARATAGARLVVVNNNQPIAAIVPLADLNRLEDLDETQTALGESTTDARTASSRYAGAPPARLLDLTASAGNTVVGQSESGDPLELRAAAHTLVVGATGTGKSVTLSAMLAGFHQDLDVPTRFIIGTGRSAASRIVHARAMSEPPPVSAIYVDIRPDGLNVEKFIKVIRQSMALRRARLQEVKTIAEFRKTHSDEKDPDYIVVLDEPGIGTHDEIRKLIGDLLQSGSDIGFYLWLFTQSEPGDEGMFTQRIAHRTNTAATSRAVIGTSQARGLQTGECVLATSRNDAGTPGISLFRVAAPDREPYPLIGLDQELVDRVGAVCD